MAREVYSDHVSTRKEDVYVVRLKKKTDPSDEPDKPRIEVELRTRKPRKPPKPAPAPPKEDPEESRMGLENNPREVDRKRKCKPKGSIVGRSKRDDEIEAGSGRERCCGGK